MKTVGIIGGFGPETTAEFYLGIVFECYKKTRVNRPPILVWSVPLEYKIEEDLITKATGEERYIPYLIDAAKILEKAGADFLVMPCNSLHVFIKEIRSAVIIPVLSIIEETVRFLKEKKISKVGILATSTTINRKLYEGVFKNENIKQFVPDKVDQAKIGKIINNIVLNKHDNKDKKELLKIIDKFDKDGIKDVILACTDLQLLNPKHIKIKVYDTMKILADAAVREILKN